VQYRLSSLPGVVSTAAGYTQGVPTDRPPTYKKVASGRSGHVEAVRALFDPALLSYEKLVSDFLAGLEDPMDSRGQGCDRGSNYRPGIYWHDEEQRIEAAAALAMEAARLRVSSLSVELKPASTFFYAEAVHQNYLKSGGCDPHPDIPYWMGLFTE
jgi:methionine-S-sulfoxide reductase